MLTVLHTQSATLDAGFYHFDLLTSDLFDGVRFRLLVRYHASSDDVERVVEALRALTDIESLESLDHWALECVDRKTKQ